MTEGALIDAHRRDSPDSVKASSRDARIKARIYVCIRDKGFALLVGGLCSRAGWPLSIQMAMVRRKHSRETVTLSGVGDMGAGGAT